MTLLQAQEHPQATSLRSVTCYNISVTCYNIVVTCYSISVTRNNTHKQLRFAQLLASLSYLLPMQYATTKQEPQIIFLCRRSCIKASWPGTSAYFVLSDYAISEINIDLYYAKVVAANEMCNILNIMTLQITLLKRK